MIGVEPTLPKKTDPKSVAAANYATSAFGGDRARTCYLDLAKVLLYQMSYTPVKCEPFTRDGSGIILTLPRGIPRKRMSAPFIKLSQIIGSNGVEPFTYGCKPYVLPIN
jgi:hypothetical protein